MKTRLVVSPGARYSASVATQCFPAASTYANVAPAEFSAAFLDADVQPAFVIWTAKPSSNSATATDESKLAELPCAVAPNDPQPGFGDVPGSRSCGSAQTCGGPAKGCGGHSALVTPRETFRTTQLESERVD